MSAEEKREISPISLRIVAARIAPIPGIVVKLYLAGEDVELDREQAYSWFRQAAVQGNGYAQFFLDHADVPHRPNALLAATKLLHHMGQIFRDNSVPPADPKETQMDHRHRQELQEKRIALGHKADDHEEQQYGGWNMGGM